MDVPEWQERFEDTFSVDDVACGPLLEVLGAAPYFSSFITNAFHVHLVPMDGFSASSRKAFLSELTPLSCFLIDRQNQLTGYLQFSKGGGQ